MKKMKLTNSVQLLYTIFVLTIINLGYFILYKDNQSLLLFICVSAVVYLIQCNMIYALLYPLIIVKWFKFVKKNYESSNQEGFEMLDDVITNKEKVMMLKWIQENLEDDAMMEYVNFNTSIDDKHITIIYYFR